MKPGSENVGSFAGADNAWPYRGEALDATLGGEEAQNWNDVYFNSEQGGSSPGRGIAGLGKAATLDVLEAQGWSLHPGRYVDVEAGGGLSDEDFKQALNADPEGLNAEARVLEATIAANVGGILGAQG